MFDISIRKSHGPFVLEVSGTSSARILGVVGPSGSGKSTLLNVIAGFTAPDTARVRVGDAWLLHSGDAVRQKSVRRRGVGYVCQSPLLFEHLTVRANLTYGLAAHGPNPPVDAVVSVLELGSLLDRRAGTLSGGEARRVSVGRAILSAPRVLLLDEPVTGLDWRLAQRTLALIHRVGESFDIPTIYVSHTMSDVLFLCDDLWRLEQGRLAGSGHPRELLTGSTERGPGDWTDLRNLFMADVDPERETPLTTYRFGRGASVLSEAPARGGTRRALISIRASDILLARDEPTRISARNVLVGTVTRLVERGPAVLVGVDVGTEWMVRLTPGAVRDLDITAGARVFAIVKASAISAVSA